MSTITIGTAATNTLVGVVWNGTSTAPADVADINEHILDDQAAAHPVAAISGLGGFSLEGKLYVPNRGSLIVLPGDIVAYDGRGGIVLVTSYSAAGASWVHT